MQTHIEFAFTTDCSLEPAAGKMPLMGLLGALRCAKIIVMNIKLMIRFQVWVVQVACSQQLASVTVVELASKPEGGRGTTVVKTWTSPRSPEPGRQEESPERAGAGRRPQDTKPESALMEHDEGPTTSAGLAPRGTLGPEGSCLFPEQ